MKYDFDKIISRENTNSMKVEVGKRLNPPLADDVTNLWIADMDFQTAPAVLAAMQKRLDHGIFGYGGIYDDSYYDSVIAWEKNHHNLTVCREDMFFSNGIVPAIYNFARFLVKSDEAIVTQTPCYHPFDDSAKYVGRTLYYNKLIARSDGYYEIDFEDFERICARPETKLFLLCNPHNPSGRVWTEAELRKLYEIAKKNGVRIVSDEIHCDLIRRGNVHIPLASLYPDDKSIITCFSITKTFNLAGLQISNVFIRDEELKKVWRNEQNEGLPNPFAVCASVAALTEGEDWLDALTTYLDETFETLDAFIKKAMPKAVFRIPEGTYLAWIDLSAYGFTKDELKKRLLYDARAFVEFEDEFADNGEGHIRVNVALPRKVLMEAMERIAKALEN